MSLQSVLARISEIQGAMGPLGATPPAATPTPPTAPTSASGSFSSQLQTAMAGAGATAEAGAPAQAATPGAAATGPASKRAAPGSFPHLTGHLDAKPELLRRLEALAARKGMKFHVTSGHRSVAEQQRLWDNRHSNPFPVARPGTSRHHGGTAADVTIGGRPIQSVISARELRAAGLRPLAGDAVHVELPH